MYGMEGAERCAPPPLFPCEVKLADPWLLNNKQLLKIERGFHARALPRAWQRGRAGVWASGQPKPQAASGNKPSESSSRLVRCCEERIENRDLSSDSKGTAPMAALAAQGCVILRRAPVGYVYPRSLGELVVIHLSESQFLTLFDCCPQCVLASWAANPA